MYKKRYFIPILPLVILAAFLVGATAAYAQEITRATLTAEGESPSHGEGLTVGDPIKLTLSVTHPADQHVILPQLESSWGDFIVHSQSPAATVTNPDGTKTTSTVIDVRLFAPGTFTTPDLPISVSDSSGQLSEVTADPITLVIGSVLVEGDTQLRDIKPQAELPYLNLYPWILGGLLFAGVISGAALWRRRRQTSLALAAIDNRLPHEVALDELDHIERSGLPEAGRFKEHYTLVSDTIRVYMERTFKIPVVERTTSEIRSSLKGITVTPEVSRQFTLFLDESDLVKFSVFTPDVEHAHGLLETGRQIVTDTKPVVNPTGGNNAATGNPQSDYPASKGNQPTEVTA